MSENTLYIQTKFKDKHLESSHIAFKAFVYSRMDYLSTSKGFFETFYLQTYFAKCVLTILQLFQFLKVKGLV